MVRAILGVIVGYIAMSVAVVTTFTGAYLILGAKGAFEPGAWLPSPVWLVLSVVLGLIGAIIGGLVCAMIAKVGSKAPLTLAVLVLVLGLVMAGLAFAQPENPDRPMPRPDEVGNFDAMMYAESPTWSILLNPVLGVVGVLIGARLAGKGKD